MHNAGREDAATDACDIPGVTVELGSDWDRKNCLTIIDRKIVGCERNTDFISNTESKRYPGCLPIFDELAKKCIAFYHNERAKCSAGGAGGAGGTARSGDGSGPDRSEGGSPNEAHIGGFRFSCWTSDNKKLQPRHGDIPRVTVELGSDWQRNECLKIIDRKIYGCSINTDFGGYRNREKRYPECLPVFEKQAQECSAFYENERAKCGTGGTGSQEAADDTESREAVGDTESREAVGDTESREAVGDTESREAVGGCSDINVASHNHDVAPVSCEGPVVNGKAHGRWFVRFPEGGGHTHEGSYVHGMMHGRWTEHWSNGECYFYEYSADVLVEGSGKEC